MRLHEFHRSGASWRVRIALRLKGMSYEQVSYNLRRGDHRSPHYEAKNHQALVPSLELDDGTFLTQSLAIIAYLDDIQPTPRLIPGSPIERARVIAFALAIAADTHPLQNLRVLEKLRNLGLNEAVVTEWAADIVRTGLTACERMVADGPYCFGSQVTMADICLAPQLAGARRFNVDVEAFPRLVGIEAALMALPSFADAIPDRQPDAG